MQLYNIYIAGYIGFRFKFNTSTQPQYDSDKEVTHRFSPPSLMLRSQTMEKLQL